MVKSRKQKKAEYYKKWAADNKEYLAQYRREYAAKHKKRLAANKVRSHRKVLSEIQNKCVNEYGGSCLFCGEDRKEGLVFHHVYGMRGKKRTNQETFYRDLIARDFPDDVVLLCGTCHLILHRTE